jgi:RNA polymerase sigma factor (sigma-70 family)
MAYGIAYAMLGDTSLAQDAAQEAFIAAYLNLAALREAAAFPGWFRRVVVKHSDRERRSLRASEPLDESIGHAATLPDPVRVLEASENKSAIHKAIAELPAIQKQIITLFYLRDYSQKEIEEFLELPVSMIKKHLFTARKKLKGGWKLWSRRKSNLIVHRNRMPLPAKCNIFSLSAPAISNGSSPWRSGSLICLRCALRYLSRARDTTGLWAERPSIGRLLPVTKLCSRSSFQVR